MEKNSPEITKELEQMREQFKVLTEKVEKQNVISEKQLWSAVKGKMKAYDWWETWVQIFGLLAGCPALIMVSQNSGMPSWVNIMTVAYCVLGIVFILFKKHRMNRMVNYNGDVKHFASGIQAVKKLHTSSIAISLPLALLYIILFGMEFFCATRSSIADISTASAAAFVCLTIATAALALLVGRKKRALLDDIITEIEE